MNQTVKTPKELAPEASTQKKLLKWAINIIVPLIFLCIPTTQAYTQDIKLFFVITTLMIIMMATENIPMFASVILLPVFYAIFLNQPNSVVYAPWLENVPWISLGGSLITMALTKTGLLRRIAYRAILLCGGRFVGVLFGMVLVGTLVSTIMTDMLAKAILLSALGLGICSALDFKLGSREASAIGLTTMAACLGPSYLFYTGSGGNVTSLGILESILPGTAPSWLGYMTQMALPQLIYIALTILAVYVFFRPKQKIESANFLRTTLKEMGGMSTNEKKTALVGLAMIVLVATSSIHGISTAQLFLLGAATLFLPFMKVLVPEDVKDINLTAILFVVSCLTIGTVSSKIGVGTFIADLVYPYISGSVTTTFVGTWIMGFVANFGLTPNAAYSMFTDPLTQIAVAEGLNPLPLIYTFIHSLEQILLPYEYAPVLVIYGTGMISMGRFVKYNAIRAVISLACILLVFMPFWRFIGLL